MEKKHSPWGCNDTLRNQSYNNYDSSEVNRVHRRRRKTTTQSNPAYAPRTLYKRDSTETIFGYFDFSPFGHVHDTRYAFHGQNYTMRYVAGETIQVTGPFEQKVRGVVGE